MIPEEWSSDCNREVSFSEEDSLWAETCVSQADKCILKKEPADFEEEKGGQGKGEQHDEWEDGWKWGWRDGEETHHVKPSIDVKRTTDLLLSNTELFENSDNAVVRSKVTFHTSV